jgi:hypothetical protein
MWMARFTIRNSGSSLKPYAVGKCMKQSEKSCSLTLGTMPLPFTWIHVESVD